MHLDIVLHLVTLMAWNFLNISMAQWKIAVITVVSVIKVFWKRIQVTVWVSWIWYLYLDGRKVKGENIGKQTSLYPQKQIKTSTINKSALEFGISMFTFKLKIFGNEVEGGQKIRLEVHAKHSHEN